MPARAWLWLWLVGAGVAVVVAAVLRTQSSHDQTPADASPGQVERAPAVLAGSAPRARSAGDQQRLFAVLVGPGADVRVDALVELTTLLRAGRLSPRDVLAFLLASDESLDDIVRDALLARVTEFRDVLLAEAPTAFEQAREGDSLARQRALRVLRALKPLRPADVPDMLALLRAFPAAGDVHALAVLAFHGDHARPLADAIVRWRTQGGAAGTLSNVHFHVWRFTVKLENDAVSPLVDSLLRHPSLDTPIAPEADPRRPIFGGLLTLVEMLDSIEATVGELPTGLDEITRLLLSGDDALVAGVLPFCLPHTNRWRTPAYRSALIRLVRSGSPAVARPPIRALRKLDDVRKTLRWALGHDDAGVRGAAAEELCRLGVSDPRVIETLRSWLRPDNPNRVIAAEALASAWSLAMVALPEMLQGAAEGYVTGSMLAAVARKHREAMTEPMRSSNPRLRIAAHDTLTHWAVATPKQREILIESLHDELPRVRAVAAFMLADTDVDRVISTLRDSLASESYEVVSDAITALHYSLSSPPHEALDDVARAFLRWRETDLCSVFDDLTDKLLDKRFSIAIAWLERGPSHYALACDVLERANRSAFPFLKNAIRVSEPFDTRRGAVKVLVRRAFHDDDDEDGELVVRKILARVLNDPDPRLRLRAAVRLSSAQHTPAVASALLALLADRNPKIMLKAAQTLAFCCRPNNDKLDAASRIVFFNHRDHPHAATRDVVRQAELAYRLR